MADKYASFEELSQQETSGVDFRILLRGAEAALAIVAPHGGGIEPGTSEIADAIAAEKFSFYTLEGLKSQGNGDLHITSTRFDEPLCLTVIARSEVVVTLHGEHSDTNDARVFLGGLDEALASRIGQALEASDFAVGRHRDPRLQGREPKNVCNRGRSGKGVQLELSRALRRELFLSLTREGRKQTTARFRDFVDAVRGALAQPAAESSQGCELHH